jgi:hypothetical protein
MGIDWDPALISWIRQERPDFDLERCQAHIAGQPGIRSPNGLLKFNARDKAHEWVKGGPIPPAIASTHSEDLHKHARRRCELFAEASLGQTPNQVADSLEAAAEEGFTFVTLRSEVAVLRQWGDAWPWPQNVGKAPAVPVEATTPDPVTTEPGAW